LVIYIVVIGSQNILSHSGLDIWSMGKCEWHRDLNTPSHYGLVIWNMDKL